MEDLLHKKRHSLAHILAMAVLEVRPGTKLGFGPPIEDGLYYDFILPEPLSEEDFPKIEKAMRKIINKGVSFERQLLKKEDALKKIDEMGEPYKREYALELMEKKNLNDLTFYQSGNFVDMCDGPHVESSKEIAADCFKVRSMSAAYWRGDSKKESMTRIYVWAFNTKEELKERVRQYEEGLKRDHRKLGKELEIFHIDDDIGKGLPLWLPNGTVLRDELEKLIKELEFKAGFYRVATPQITKTELYHKTGHLPYYSEHIYPEMKLGSDDGKEESYCLRPMNCPHHHKIFDQRPRSYRELPLRLAEYGQVYRYEDSGSLSGLLRVRGMCMNDAHIYCRPDQVKEEFRAVMEMHKEVYEILGIKDYYMRLSCWDPEDPKAKEKYVNNPKAWELSEQLVREAMEESGLPTKEVKGEAAFYGPKIDIQFKTVTGREETASTCQLDFAVPERLGLVYTDESNQEIHPYVIHRAPLGTHERFLAFLIEQYAGAFPTWLAPIQVMVVPVADKFQEYAYKIQDTLRQNYVRVEVDNSPHSFNKKIRVNSKKKIPNLLIIGEKEMENGEITLRKYGVKEQETWPLEKFIEWINQSIKTRANC